MAPRLACPDFRISALAGDTRRLSEDSGRPANPASSRGIATGTLHAEPRSAPMEPMLPFSPMHGSPVTLEQWEALDEDDSMWAEVDALPEGDDA